MVVCCAPVGRLCAHRRSDVGECAHRIHSEPSPRSTLGAHDDLNIVVACGGVRSSLGLVSGANYAGYQIFHRADIVFDFTKFLLQWAGAGGAAPTRNVALDRASTSRLFDHIEKRSAASSG